MADEANKLGFEIIAEVPGFTGPLREAAGQSKQAAEQISANLSRAVEAAQKLNSANAEGFGTAISEAAEKAGASTRSISSAISGTVEAASKLNDVSTSGFSKGLEAAALAAETNSRRIEAAFRKVEAMQTRIASAGREREVFSPWSPTISRRMTGAPERTWTPSTAAMSAESGLASASQDASAIARVGEEAEHSVPRMAAASAGLRALSGNFEHNLRAAERFSGMLPGVGAALDMAFPAIGAATLATVLVDTGMKLAQFKEKAEGMPQSIKDAFDSLAVSTQLGNDELDLSTVKMENVIAKLEHHPQNSIAEALAAASVQADKFAESLDKAYNATKSLLATNRITVGMSLLTGQGSTDTIEGSTNSFNRDLANIQNRIANAQSDNNQPLVTSLQKDLRDKLAAARSYNQKTLSSAQDAQKSGFFGDTFFGLGKEHENQQGIIDVAQANLRGYDQIERGQKLEQRYDADSSRLDKDQAEKTAQDQAKENARKALEAQKQAQQAALLSLNDQYAKLKAAHEMTAQESYDFWTSVTNTDKLGAAGRLEVARNIGSAYQEVLRDNAEKVKAAQEAAAQASKTPGGFRPDFRGFFGQEIQAVTPAEREQTPLREGDLTQDRDFTQSQKQSGAAAGEYLKTLQSGVDASSKQSDAQREQAIQMASASGEASRYSTALATSTLHANEYTAALDKLNDALAAARQNTAGLTDIEVKVKTSNVEKQIQDLNDARSLQSVQDAATLNDTQLELAWKASLSHFVQDSQDAAKQIGQIFSSTIDSVNSSLSTTLTARYHTSRERDRAVRNSLSEDARGVASSLTNTGLQRVEGSALGALGFGSPATKPDGSQSKPLWVKLVDKVDGKGADGSGLPGSQGEVGSNASLLSRLPFVPSALRPMLGNAGADPLNLARQAAPDMRGVTEAIAAQAPMDLSRLSGLFPAASQQAPLSTAPVSLANNFGIDTPDFAKAVAANPLVPQLSSDTLQALSSFPQMPQSLVAAAGFPSLSQSSINMATPEGQGSTTSQARPQGSLLGDIVGGAAKSFPDLAKLIPGFQGFFAEGGDVVAGHPSIVGENGPEPFIPDVPGHIVSNNDYRNMAGDTHHHEYNFNVRNEGSQDPAATHAATMRAIKQSLPMISTATIGAIDERNKRRPTSSR